MNHHDTYGVFPHGTRLSFHLPPEKRLSWFVSILPFLEQDNLWSAADKDQSWDAASNRLISRTEVKVLMCPANLDVFQSKEWGITGYVGMAGVGADAATFPLEDKRAGFFGYDRRVRIKDVADGLSNTIMVMETTSELGPWAAGGPSTVRGLDPEDQPYLAVGGLFGVKHREDTIFRSNPVGSNIAIADASIRWVPATVSSETLEALATIAGGDTPGDDY